MRAGAGGNFKEEDAMNADELRVVLEKHKKWLNGEDGGKRANLIGADLIGANLSGANLIRADLSVADLRGADLRGADIDYACWPLWCGSKTVKVDAKIARQLAAHFCVLDCDDQEYQAAREAILEFSKKSHRAEDLGIVS